MQKLFKIAETNYQQGQKKAAKGNLRASCDYYQKSLDDLRALQPTKPRDILMARVYLARYEASKDFRGELAQKDLRFGYSYARTSKDPSIQALAEKYWQAQLENKD